jgi:hypothetical protein
MTYSLPNIWRSQRCRRLPMSLAVLDDDGDGSARV